MPLRPAELVRRSIETRLYWVDRERFFQGFTDDVVVEAGSHWPSSGRRSGLEAARAFFDEFTEAFPDAVFTIGAMEERCGGDLLVIDMRYDLRGSRSGVELTAEYVWVERFRDGKLAYIGIFPNRGEAERAAAEQAALVEAAG